ncbi:MAG: hypothetical protein IT318_15710, partial [Anaerolineales bacterium]|nr:hypothetical protein [Anaerolineales bacterium]
MSPAASDFNELEDRLADWELRLRLREALQWSLRGLGLGLALGLALALLARLRPLLSTPALIAAALSLALAGFGAALALAYFWPRSRLASARYFDDIFDLKERTATALELAGSAAPGWLRRGQWADAAAAARRVDPRRQLRFRIDWREAMGVVGVAVALGLTLYLPNPQQAVLAHQNAVDQAIAEQIEALEDALEAIEANPNLTEEQK